MPSSFATLQIISSMSEFNKLITLPSFDQELNGFDKVGLSVGLVQVFFCTESLE